jgi:phosphoribosyl 1,2-cyclic phosphodiesterase
MVLKFWGTRGSIPVPGSSTLKYGGNTPCVELRTEENKLLILDAGSGIRELGKDLQKKGFDNNINILISHYHWDHIQGVPFFLPLYKEGVKVCFWGESCQGESIHKILSNQMTDNYFPIKLNELNANIEYFSLKTNDSFELDGLKIDTLRAKHSSPTVTYKIRENGKCIVYLTDNELEIESAAEGNTFASIKNLNRELIEFCRGCDYLIHDSMYDEAAMLLKKGWGHTGNVTLALFAIIAEVKNLVLFHYNPDYSDDKIDELLNQTKVVMKERSANINCIAAQEGMKIAV